MAASNVLPWTMRGSNPNIGFLSATPSVAATGATGDIIFPMMGASGINIIFSVPSTAVATVEGSCDNPETLSADTTAGTWKAINAALTGVTTGAIVLSTIPPGIVAIRVNVGTALAANVATVKLSTTNPNTY